MPVAWSEANDKQLLLCIIHLAGAAIPKNKWEAVAEMMGDGYTAESTRQHYMKLVKKCKEDFGDPATTAPSTPKKSPAAANGSTPKKSPSVANGSTPKRAKGKKAAAEMDNRDDDDRATNGESPSKKVKSEPIENDTEEGLH